MGRVTIVENKTGEIFQAWELKGKEYKVINKQEIGGEIVLLISVKSNNKQLNLFEDGSIETRKSVSRGTKRGKETSLRTNYKKKGG